MGGSCDFSVNPSLFSLDFVTLDFGTSDSGLTIISCRQKTTTLTLTSDDRNRCADLQFTREVMNNSVMYLTVSIISFQMVPLIYLKIFIQVFSLILVTVRVGARNLNHAGPTSIKETVLENCELDSFASSVKKVLAEVALDNCFEQNITGEVA